MRKTAPKADDEPRGAPSERPDASAAVDPWIRCRACGARITHERERIELNGAHRHEFMNPAGIRFVIGCFARAIGTVGVGECSSVWSWFPGYAWQADACTGCGAHLGWSFRVGSTVTEASSSGGVAAVVRASFHGLILAELA